jgi:hypothetical protein
MSQQSAVSFPAPAATVLDRRMGFYTLPAGRIPAGGNAIAGEDSAVFVTKSVGKVAVRLLYAPREGLRRSLGEFCLSELSPSGGRGSASLLSAGVHSGLPRPRFGKRFRNVKQRSHLHPHTVKRAGIWRG